MVQILHACARTTEKTRRGIQLRQETIMKAAKGFGVNAKTIVKWRKRATTRDAPMGPKKESLNCFK